MSLFLCPSNMQQPATKAEQAIRERIRKRGKITFAEFMQTALYHHVDGYYTSDNPFGADGDYYTSPAVHPAFGALLSVHLFTLWRLMNEPSDFAVIEMGAGNGFLAGDICNYASNLSDRFAACLRYVCIDRYTPPDVNLHTRRTHNPIEWLRASSLPLNGVVGCFVSNEFVDAFPVHRFQIIDGELSEVYVALDEAGEFTEVLDKPSTPLIAQRLNRLGFTLADGQQGEVSLGVKSWLTEVSRALAKGFVITIDYGYEASALYSPQRRFGTLQTYYRHTEGGSPYQRIGRQDISAHVDFSLLQSEGQALGINTVACVKQSDFLDALGIRDMMRDLRSARITQHERSANLMALRTLMNPDGLGRFKVLIQEKATGIGINEASRIEPQESVRQALHIPLLSSRHIPLMEGRYPHIGWETPTLWDEWGQTSPLAPSDE